MLVLGQKQTQTFNSSQISNLVTPGFAERRPSTAPVRQHPSINAADVRDLNKRSFERNGGRTTRQYGDLTGRYALNMMRSDRSRGITHATYVASNRKVHSMLKEARPVMEFKAMFEQRVRSEPLGTYGVEPHACVLRFYVEDGTVEVTELPVNNSGRVEKRLVRRHKIRKPETMPDGNASMNATVNSHDTEIGRYYYGADDLYPGSLIHAGGMDFRIIDATAIAREYLTTRQRGGTADEGSARGGGPARAPGAPMIFDDTFLSNFADSSTITVGDSAAGSGLKMRESPGSRFDATAHFPSRKSRTASMLTQQQGRGGKPPLEALHFDLVWDDSSSLYGNVYELRLKYNLLDDTVDVGYKDANAGSASGKYPSKSVVKRQKLPRQPEHSAPIQGTDSSMRLTTEKFSNRDGLVQSRQGMQDVSAPGSFIHWSELLPGTAVNVFGRNAEVVGFADPRTKAYFVETGVVPPDSGMMKPPHPHGTLLPTIKHPVPGYLGLGSFEDSMRSVRDIQPVVPPYGPAGKQDPQALKAKLQFKAKLISSAPSDRGREFILTFFSNDCTLMLYEMAPRNTGRFSSVFSKRAKVIRFEGAGEKEPEYYGMDQIYIGSRLTINSHDFVLTDAPVGTLRFMETHCVPAFPKANIREITEKLRSWFVSHEKFFLNSGTALSAIEVHKLLRESGREDVSETTLHECFTLSRAANAGADLNTKIAANDLFDFVCSFT